MPELRLEQLLDSLANGKPVPAILLLGSDVYLRDLCRNKLIETFVPEAARDWALARFSAAERGWDEIFERAQTVPMLSPQQVLILEEVEALDELGDDARDEAVESFESYLANPAPFTMLVLQATELDARKKLYKLLSDRAVTVALEMDASQAAALAISTAKEFGTTLEPGAASLLVDAVNAEPARIRIEVDKLSLYAQGRSKISREDVEELVVAARKYTVWQLADLIGGAKCDAALVFLDGLLREGEQPAMMVGALAWMYRKLIESRELPAQMNKYQAARQLSMNPDSAEQALRLSRRIPNAQLLAGLAALADADSMLKSGVANPRAVMEFLVTRLVAGPAAA